MKKLYLVAITLVMSASMLLANGDPCGVLSLGSVKLDLTRNQTHSQIKKDALVNNIKQGFAYTGSSECPGTFEIVDLSLTIKGARDAQYNYDFEMVSKMKTMEDFMLVRYFNDAESVSINNIKVRNSKGDVLELPSVSLDVQ